MSDSIETSEDMAQPYMGAVPGDSAAACPIERAVQLLREGAAEIAQSVSISDVPDWANEPDSKAAHDEALMVAQHLESLAPFMLQAHRERKAGEAVAWELLTQALDQMDHVKRVLGMGRPSPEFVSQALDTRKLRAMLAAAPSPDGKADNSPCACWPGRMCDRAKDCAADSKAEQAEAPSEEVSQPWYDLAWANNARQHTSYAGDELTEISFTPAQFEAFCSALAAQPTASNAGERNFADFVQCQPCEMIDPDATCPQCPGWLKTLDDQLIEDCFQEAAGADEETHLRFAHAVIAKFL